jgi:hypothetical protein
MSSDEQAKSNFLLIVCETLFAERVSVILGELKVPGYTRFGGVSGIGETGRHEGTAVWPGTNTIIFTVLPDPELAAEIVRRARRVIAEHYKVSPGFKAFALRAEELA